MHREDLVVGLGGEKALVGTEQLSAQQKRLDAPRTEEGERGEEVEKPDPLVICRGQPTQQAWTRLPHSLQALCVLMCAWCDDGGHG